MGVGTWVAIATPLSGFILGVLGFIFARRQDRASARKTDADALKVVQDATLELLGPYRESVKNLNNKVEQLETKVGHLEAENTYIVADNKELRDRVDIVEDDRTTLAEAVAVQVEWEDSGRLDPPGAPSIPAKVRLILNRLHAA